MKFQANYRITVYNHDSTIIIGAHEEKQQDGTTKIVQDNAQLTVHFNVSRAILSDSNKCTIEIYNLAPSTREKIFQDAFQGWDSSKWKYVRLEAGYDGQLTPIFMGRILQAYSHRQGGQTDIITEIQAQALDIFDCQSSHTFEAGTTYKEAIQTIVTTDMPNVAIGNIGEIEGIFQTKTTVDGTAMENLNTITGGNAFVDNNQVNVLLSNEVIDVPVPVITEKNGLLDTPDRRDANLEVKMLFEPSLQVGQLLQIESGVSPNFNGQYKVVGFTHDCVISDSEAGQRTTTVNLYIGPFLPGAEQLLSGQSGKGFNKVRGMEVIPVNAEQQQNARATYNYIQRTNGKIPNTKITTNISWKDMIGHNNTDADRKNECSLGTLVNCVATATQLQSIYNTYWKGRTLSVSSGWRSRRNNTACGGASNSYHLKGMAVDFNLGIPRIRRDFQTMQRAWNGWLLNEGTWIHADIRGFKGYANDK